MLFAVAKLDSILNINTLVSSIIKCTQRVKYEYLTKFIFLWLKNTRSNDHCHPNTYLSLEIYNCKRNFAIFTLINVKSAYSEI